MMTTPIISDELADLFGPHIVTVITETEVVTAPATVRVYRNGTGEVFMIQSLYDPDTRLLWCQTCGAVTVHILRGKKFICRQEAK